MWREILFVGLGGFAGSALRYFVGRVINTTQPFATFLVNITGCLVLGILCGLVERGGLDNNEWRLFLTVGLCGGFTTFSTFINENLAMLRGGEFGMFMLYAVGSFAVGLALCWAGWQLAK